MTINWDKLKTLESIQAEREAAQVAYLISENNKSYEQAITVLTSDYPALEKDTWPTQQAEVSAWVLNPEASTPWIDLAAQVRGIDRIEYLKRTLVKTLQFKLMSAFLTGRRQLYEDQINAGLSPEFNYELTPELLVELEAIRAEVFGQG